MRCRKLSILLAKEEFTDPRQMVVNPDKLEWISYGKDTIAQELAFRFSANPPNWLSFVNEDLAAEISDKYNFSNSALVFIRYDDRFFILTFGHGRSMVEQGCFVRDFGLRTVINAVDPDRLRSVDSAETESTTRQTRSQTSRASSPIEFGLDVTRDILRSVSGDTLEEYQKDLGKTITGKDSLQITANVNLSKLDGVLKRILECYKSNRYKQNFDWIDNLREEKDPRVISELNEALVNDLNKEHLEKCHLAVPEIYEPGTYDGFSYISKEGENHVDLDIRDAISDLKKKNEVITLNRLKKSRVYLIQSGLGSFQKWSIYECIVYETDSNDSRFVLAMGNWYCIDNDFVRRVTSDVRAISDLETLPTSRREWEEKIYNEHLSNAISGSILLDRDLVRCDGARTSIEFCDVLTSDRKIIHVKKKSSSSTLSHLFAQGRISAVALLSDKQVLSDLRKKISAKGKDPDVYFPKNGNDLNSKEFTVVFAIIDSSPHELDVSLPFFSLLNLRQAERTIRLFGFKVAKAKIQIQ